MKTGIRASWVIASACGLLMHDALHASEIKAPELRQWTLKGALTNPPTRISNTLALSDQSFDSETMPEWFGMPQDADLPSTFSIDYARAWRLP